MLFSPKKHLFVTLVLITSVGGIFANKPLNLRQASKQFAKDSEELALARTAVVEYYQSGEFEKEVADICKKSLKRFISKAKIHWNSITETTGYSSSEEEEEEKKITIIADIDETLLLNLQWMIPLKFKYELGKDTYEHRFKKECTAIKPMLSLCKKLKKLGYTIIGLSSRREKLHKATSENLKEQGFDIDEVILMPEDIFANKSKKDGIKPGDWKEGVRKELSKRYKIIGCLGDSDDDFKGECCGYKVQLPNYLY